MVKPFDLAQTTFIFSWISNYSSYTSGTATELAKYVRASLDYPDDLNENPFKDLRARSVLKNPAIKNQLAAGDWELVWGPGVVESSGHAANTAYMVYSPTLNTHVLAIAGTDPASFVNDWYKEDGRVGGQDNIDWVTFVNDIDMDLVKHKQAASKDVAQISLGTATGVQRVIKKLTYCDGTTLNLIDYIHGIGTGGTLIVTGHSLGGALAPTVARFIHDNASTKGVFSQIHAMPIAGPSAGNAVYQKDWDKVFKPVSSGSSTMVSEFNKDVFCTADIVPHAWQNIYQRVLKEEGTESTSSLSKMYPYFYGQLPEEIHWKYGTLTHFIFKSELAGILPLAQGRGDNAHMQTAAHIVGFDYNTVNWLKKNKASDKNSEGIQTYNIEQLVVDPDPKGIGSFLGNVGMVHVWSYGQIAFEIPLSFWEQVDPRDKA